MFKRAFYLSALVPAVLLLAGCGKTTSNPPTTEPVNASPAATTASASSGGSSSQQSTTSCIQQGNVQDNDADNHGGPDDGDGCQ